MPFQGELRQATAYNINVDNGQSGNKPTAITIVKINKRDKVAAAETFSVAAGARTALADTIGLRIDRVIIQVHPPRGATVPVEVVQGNNSFVETCVGDTDLVFEAIP